MSYESIALNQELIIDKLYSMHYFEYMNDFVFDGETHDFWEFLCVDKGEVSVTADDREYQLKKGDIIFHRPNEFHSVRCNGKSAPNLVVIAFECVSPAMNFFEQKQLVINEHEQNLLGKIIQESRRTFEGRLDNPYQTKLIISDSAPFGGEHLIRNYIEQLLISLIRRYNFALLPKEQLPGTTKLTAHNADNELYEKIIHYMEEHITENIAIEQLCKDTLIGRSKAQRLFHERHNCGVINYFSAMKITAAKELIRSNSMNFTQISEHLGYTSIHYFSRQFKKTTGMTPSEYATSIKGLSETKNF